MNYAQVTKHSNFFAYKFRDVLTKKGSSNDLVQIAQKENYELHSHESVRSIVFKEYLRMDTFKFNKFKFVDLQSLMNNKESADKVNS